MTHPPTSQTHTSSLTGLGRRFVPDARDQAYLLPRPPSTAALPTYRYWISPGDTLDQGATSQCVIYAMEKYLTANPVRNLGFSSPEHRTMIYKAVQALDQWAGDDYDGTSVRAACKWMVARKLASAYQWAFDVEPVVNHLLTKGPVLLGTSWHLSMFTPDRAGYVDLDQIDMGGHAYLAIGANRTKKNGDGSVGAVQCINSWGPNWGPINGRFWISFRDLDQLIRDNGEAAVITEIRG